jgi:hypothetical protein
MMVHIGEPLGISRIDAKKSSISCDHDSLPTQRAIALKAVNTLFTGGSMRFFSWREPLGPVHNIISRRDVVEHPPLPKSSHHDVKRFSYLTDGLEIINWNFSM